MASRGRIPDTFKDELLARTDVVELINSYVPLKKAGTVHKARCPFHDEKTPSFSVNGQKQFYHCFGCGASGNAISFMMDYLHMDFVSAIEELAGMAGLQVPRENSTTPAKPSVTHLYDIMEWVTEFYQQSLRHEHSEQSVVDEYVKKRGLSHDMVERFRLGYAPPGWDALTKRSQKKEGLLHLVQTGMVVEKSTDRHYDRFRDRFMFPIRDPRGRVIAFGGRVLPSSTDQGAKYLNSPETDIFSKSFVLYGLFEARRYTKKLELLIVVEGYMDVVALAEQGVSNAVATLGTAVTTHHIKTLFQTVDQVVFSFDGDTAGLRAAEKAMSIVLPHIRDGRQAKFLLLPEGDDPDSIVLREGKVHFESLVHDALPLSEFMFQRLSDGVDLSSIDGKAQLVERSKPLIKLMADGVYKKMIAQQLSQLTQLPTDEFGVIAAKPNTPKTTVTRPRAKQAAGQKAGQNSLVRTAVALLVQNPSLAEHASPRQFEGLDMPGVDLLREILQVLHQHPNLSTAMLLEKWRDTELSHVLYKLANQAFSIPESGMEEEFIGAIERLLEKVQQQRLDNLLHKSQQMALTESEKSELNLLLQR
ncbi:MAG: DNA primase [Methylococcales bacterium]|nr:DNA primase [Methylococcales bacterium]MBT7446059.1 DNA primase [Methylococcales bacterium]